MWRAGPRKKSRPVEGGNPEGELEFLLVRSYTGCPPIQKSIQLSCALAIAGVFLGGCDDKTLF
jgi:hypothetical protein